MRISDWSSDVCSSDLNWIYSRLEQAAGQSTLDKAGKQRVLDGLTAAEGLERYLHTKYVDQKRFSLEGGDRLIPMIDDVVREAGDNGIKELVIGMAHRGRLTVLFNILGKPPKTTFDERAEKGGEGTAGGRRCSTS